VFYTLSRITAGSIENDVSSGNVSAVEKILHNFQNESRKIILSAISGNQDSIVPDFDSICTYKKLHEKGVYIFVIDTISSASEDTDRIHYWSDNIPVTAKQLDNVGEDSKYLYFGNGWYVAQAFRHGKFKYVSLILVVREYVYQNRFLKNGTNPAFDFSDNIIILPLGDVGIPVKDIKGVPLFVVNSSIPSTVTSGISLLFRWLAVIACCLLMGFIFCNSELYRRNLWNLLLAFVLLLGLRIFIFCSSDFFNGDLYLFSPSLYADSELFPSLGDLLLHLLFMYMFVVILFSARETLYQRVSGNRTFFVLSCFFAALFLSATLYITESIAFNSEISFKVYKINDVTVYTFMAYFILALAFAQLCLITYLQIFIFRESFMKKGRFIMLITIILPSLFVPVNFVYKNLIFAVLYIIIYFLLLRKSRFGITLSTFVWLTVFISVYVSFSLITNTEKKEYRQREALAKGLIVENDPVAEMLLKDMEDKISADPYIKRALHSGSYNNTDLYEFFYEKYFRGYFHNYELSYYVCWPHIILQIMDEDKTVNCVEFFTDEKNSGIPLPKSSHFRFMNRYLGRIHYLGDFQYVEDKDTAFLFLELYSRREIESPAGYPELLRPESGGIDYESNGYSYAKYANGKRISKVGTYDYSFEFDPKYQEGFFEKNGYSHYILKSKDDDVAILSLPELSYSDMISIFSYSFVIFILILLIIFSIAGMKPEISTNRNSYRWKITVVILSGIIGSLTVLTVAMLTYIVSQSEKKNLDAIHSKMQSAIIELDQSLFDIEKIVPEMYTDLEMMLVVLSNAFNTDLNMYDMSGNLMVSSRNEIFDKNLVGKKMNREALHTLVSEKQSKFIHTERIGTISYFSSYATYYNRRGEAIACLNILHFNNQSEFRNELLSLTGAVMNIYIFLIVIGIALAVFVSNQITRPLDLVRRKMAEMSLAEKSEPIDYKDNNELGDLVRAYNRMIGELAHSAKIMAENERESAWREMARQIAHEIKNPLTPMKLNIQLALRMKKQNRQGWKEKMDDAIKSTLEQIDILTYIASEFSNFARMGEMKQEPVYLSQSIRSAISLFSGYDEIKIRYDDGEKDYCVNANREQLQRVLTNLLKNSVQALENVSNPEIIVELDKREDCYVIRISDNGSGIPDEVAENLFRPNFTTKSGGTGLGLAISKSIIESFGGTVLFVPKIKGACFEILLK
jgi:signal transduction histidine kinase